MAGQYDLSLSGDTQAAKDLVARVVGEQGFTAQTNPNGGLTVKRGNMTATMLLGALAGKNLQMTFFIEYFSGENNTLVVRLSRNTGAGVMKGGAIGMARTDDAFKDLVNAVAAAAASVGTYVSSTSA